MKQKRRRIGRALATVTGTGETNARRNRLQPLCGKGVSVGSGTYYLLTLPSATPHVSRGKVISSNAVVDRDCCSGIQRDTDGKGKAASRGGDTLPPRLPR